MGIEIPDSGNILAVGISRFPGAPVCYVLCRQMAGALVRPEVLIKETRHCAIAPAFVCTRAGPLARYRPAYETSFQIDSINYTILNESYIIEYVITIL
jgi:hypothetical protein